ncbi:AI-2E family transporter [Shewanella fidelis]|uniref:AI-2E family transporter n=1 Tax=Shewanella fidelis TaxID=173509 RepID=A0AAW8NP49_9GAMM|nr:AI-2E family transporter [Shewanella fidelis]MDR8523594.1 AI-2E family transporter [Shewanella fidelis]MDW4810141.1 AI-2E family transporter [Shewanella fidelis]MDW4814286.1 AI-2E family transporter [Shewanella fidelis]MDW4818377.1 AI-2E family transporter [Shewanella fidelis]MDW4823971.1 AI-2E family transporter [Shewanella fidelis]
MENPMQHNQSKLFINNMMESAIRIGLLFILVVWTFDIIKPFVIPVLWGAIIAVALMPMTQKLERALKGRRGLAATILAFAGITLLIAPFWIVTSSIFEGISHSIEVLQSGEVDIPGPTQKIADIPLVGGQLYEVWALFATNLEKAVMHFLPQIKSAVTASAAMLGSSLGTLVMFIISLAIAGGFMAHAEKSAAAVKTVAVKVAGSHGEEWASLTAATIRSVLLGVVGVAFIQSILIGSALFTFSIPAAGLFTFIIFILGIAQLPPLIVVLPLIFYVFSTHDSTPATIFTVWVLVAGVSDSVLKPMLMGRGVDVPMPVILIGAIGGMLTAGIIGLFLGAVVLAIWYELFMTWLKTEEQQNAKVEQGAEDSLPSVPVED